MKLQISTYAQYWNPTGWLRLVYTMPRIGTLLAATRLDVRFPCHATVADALAGRTCPTPRWVRMAGPAPRGTP